MVQLSEHFGTVDGRKQSEWSRLQKQFAEKRIDDKRQKQQEDQDKENIEMFGHGMVVATELQIIQFKAKLDTYDTATVEALMENQKQLDAVRDKIEAILERAYVMDDGRRVFKTEDGKQVFDENGKEISAEELDPDLIDSGKPKWEEVKAKMELKQSLEAERTEILEFQEKVDAARERVSEGDITEAELEELDAELLDLMPSAVRSQIPELGAAENVKNAELSEASPAAPKSDSVVSHNSNSGPAPI